MNASQISKWRDAMGGAEALAGTESVHVVSRIKTMGLEGTLEQWWVADGRYRQALDLAGVYSLTNVYDDRSKSGWVLDQNGQTRRISGVSAKDELTEAYFGTYSHLVDDRMTGTIAENDGTVDIEPEGGARTTWYLGDNGLPSKCERKQADLDRTIELSEWREVDGVQFPFRIHEFSNIDKSEVDIEVVEVSRNVPVDDALFVEPQQKSADYQFVAGPAARDIPFDLYGNHIFLKTQVGDAEPTWFLLDTGAQMSCLDADYAQQLGIEGRGDAAGRGAGEGTADMSLAENVTFRVPGVEFTEKTVAITALTGSFGHFEGRKVDGILGYGFLSRFVVELDYERRRLNIHDPRWYEAPHGADVLPMTMTHGIPTIAVEMKPFGREPLSLKMVVDTGAGDSLFLNRPLVEEHDLLSTLIDDVLVPVAGVGGDSQQSVGRVESLAFGQQIMKNPVTYFAHDALGAFANPDFDGIIGGEILRRFTVAFDYAAERMVLSPNGCMDEPFEFDKSGLVLMTDTESFNSFSVRGIVPGSPAAEAGFEKGDVIIDVDGIPAREMTLAGMQDKLRSNGRSVPVTVERAGETLELTLSLHRLV